MQSNKVEFMATARKYIKRDGLEVVLEGLEKSDFFTAPASTRFHDSEECGLSFHSLKVFNSLVLDQYNGKTGYSMETLAIVSLFHDICKIGYYKIEMRNKKDEKGKWISVPFYTVEDKLPFGHGEKSVFMLMQDMKLTLEESMAIRWHMGAYTGQQDWNTLSEAYAQFPLCMHLHFADMKSTYLK